MLHLYFVYSGTCAVCRVLLLHWGRIQLRMDAHIKQLLDPLLTSWAGGTKPSVAPLCGQLLRTVGVTAAPLREKGIKERHIKDKETSERVGKKTLADAMRITMISRCTDDHWSKKDIRPKPFISPCHNGNLSTICFQFQKAPFSCSFLYPSIQVWLKLDMVKRK